MVSCAAAMLPRWLVNVSWLTRDLPPTITHSHPLFTATTTLTPLHHGPAFSSLSFFLHHASLSSTHLTYRSSTCVYPYPPATLTFRLRLHSATRLPISLLFKRGSTRFLFHDVCARPAQRFSSFPLPNDAR